MLDIWETQSFDSSNKSHSDAVDVAEARQIALTAEKNIMGGTFSRQDLGSVNKKENL